MISAPTSTLPCSKNKQYRSYSAGICKPVDRIAATLSCKPMLHQLVDSSEHYSRRTRPGHQPTCGCGVFCAAQVKKQGCCEGCEHNEMHYLVDSGEKRHFVSADGVGREGSVEDCGYYQRGSKPARNAV